jgi:hypothetical protein
METEITIFEVPTKPTSISKTQKELDYELLQKSSSLPKEHFTSFYELEMYQERLQKPSSNIPSVLCKFVAQYCTMITYTENKLGPSHSSMYSIALQSETPLYVLDATQKLHRMIAANEQFSCIGVKLPNIFIRNYNKHTLAHFDHIDTDMIAASGQYGLQDLQTYKYTQQRPTLTHPGLPSSDKDTRFSLYSAENVVTFASSEDAMKKLQIIIDYITFVEAYYDTNLPTLHLLLSTGKYKQSPKHLTVNWNSALVSHNNVLKKISSIIGEFGTLSTVDIYNTLAAQDLLYAYNIGMLLGADDEQFLAELKKKTAKLTYSAQYVNQINSEFSKKLAMTKKQNIAFNKYGTFDLDSLDSKQLKVILLEYDKLQKTLNKDLSTRAKIIQKLFHELRETFKDIESANMSNALKAVKKVLTKEELSSSELIEGGVCPHILTFAEETLKHFGKPWLNTELRESMIAKYSLPKDVSGYFCKICGEQLVEADNEDVVKFANGERVSSMQVDDPIQTMIWKEAMYIVTTYVKFNTPVPLKPLVNSLAYGLRAIIGEEEAKLYKSKTNTTDSIRDTLNLYASIYTYAALCALMIQNPNKLIFGRDKPTAAQQPKIIEKQIKEKRREGEKIRKEQSLDTKLKEAQVQKEESELSDEIAKNVSDHDKEEENAFLDSLRSTGITGDSEAPKRGGGRKRKNPSHVPYKNKFLASSSSSDFSDSDSDSEENPSLTLCGCAATLAERTTRLIREKRRNRYIRGGKVTNDVKLYERYVLTTALNLILLTKDATIKRLKNINIDVVKQIFLKNAYVWAKNHARPIKVDTDNSKQGPRIQTIIETDPFYSYLYYAKRLAYNSGEDKHYPVSIDNVKAMLGRDAAQLDEDIKKDIDIYSTIRIPTKWKFSDPRYDEYTWLSFLSTMDYIKDRIYQMDFIPRHAQVSAYYDKYAHLLSIEKEILHSIAQNNIRPMSEIIWTNDIRAKYNDFSPSKLDLAKHYCPSGERHKVGSYIYEYKSDTKELTTKEINTWLTTDSDEARSKLEEFSHYSLVNERCALCKTLIRDAKSTEKSDKSLATMFKRLDDVLAFYQYYDSRCPKGDLHDIRESICAKCGLNTSFKASSDEAYYKKYSAQFVKIELEKQQVAIDSLTRAQKDLAVIIDIKEKSVDYKYSLQKTAEWSQISGVKYNVLSNLGFTEGYKFDDIEKARVNPAKNIEELPNNAGAYKTQAIKIRSYILQVIRDYNTLLNYENIVDLNPELKEILDIQKRIDIASLQTSMPQFQDEFITKDFQYKYVLDAKNYANFLQEYLANIFSIISKDSTEKYKTLAKLLIKYFTSNIITQEKTYSKAEAVFLKVFEDITKAESDSEDENAVSADEYGNQQSAESAEEVDEENAVEVYENVIDNDAMDVENPDDIWENE